LPPQISSTQLPPNGALSFPPFPFFKTFSPLRTHFPWSMPWQARVALLFRHSFSVQAAQQKKCLFPPTSGLSPRRGFSLALLLGPLPHSFSVGASSLSRLPRIPSAAPFESAGPEFQGAYLVWKAPQRPDSTKNPFFSAY